MELSVNERAQIRQELGDDTGYLLIDDLSNVSSREEVLDLILEIAQGKLVDDPTSVQDAIYEDGYEDGYAEGFINGSHKDDFED